MDQKMERMGLLLLLLLLLQQHGQYYNVHHRSQGDAYLVRRHDLFQCMSVPNLGSGEWNTNAQRQKMTVGDRSAVVDGGGQQCRG